MITVDYLAVPLAVLLLWFIVRRKSTRVALLAIVATLHLLAVLDVAILPIPIDSTLMAGPRAAHIGHDNLVPFATIVPAIATRSSNGLGQLVGNVVMLMPLGLYLPLLLPAAKSWPVVVTTGLGASLAVEAIQFSVSHFWLRYSYRSADIDDVILNTIGVAVGYAGAKVTLAVLATKRA